MPAKKTKVIDTRDLPHSSSSFISAIIEKYGEDIIEKNEDIPLRELKVIPTGSISLDISTGIGGIPRGRFTEIFGVESSAKTSLCLSIAKQAINMGYKVLYVEPENTLDHKYIAEIAGTLNTDFFVLAQPETAEQALFICEAGIKSKEFQLIILDSVAALAPEVEKTDDPDKAHVALIPRKISAFLRRNAYDVRSSDIAFIFVNQVRDKIGTYMGGVDTPGGHALKHFLALRIQLARIEDIEKVIDKDHKEKIGINSKFTIKKNKLARPFRTFFFPFMFGKGIDYVTDLVNFSEMLGILQRRGSYYAFNGEMIGQGLAKTVARITDDKLLLDNIVKMCYNLVDDKKVEIDLDDNSSTLLEDVVEKEME
jgi:recombination protein RecA